jgi:hypothetical protein
MKLNKWSVVKTADAKGLALKPLDGVAKNMEVCVAVRNGRIEVNVYHDAFVFPLWFETCIPATPAKQANKKKGNKS